MKYEGPLYGKIGRKFVPLTMTSQDVDVMENAHKEVIHLVRNWVNEPPPDWNILSLKDAVLYALREENNQKIAEINRAEKAEARTNRLLHVDLKDQPWTPTQTMLSQVVVDPKALNMNPKAFCKIIAEELVKIIQAKTSHF